MAELATDADIVTDTDTGDTKAADKAADTKTAAAGDTATDKGDDKATDTAPDWRSEMAGEDADLLKFLGRYHSKDAALKGFRETYGSIRAGKYLKPVDENATDEEKAAWNKAIGVPEKPEDYLKNPLPSGWVPGAVDKPFVDKYLAGMHAANAPPAAVTAALDIYAGIVQEQAEATTEAEMAAKKASEDALHAEWGTDYRRNLNVVDSYLDTLPEDVREALTKGYDEDGVSLGNKAEVVKWLASLALEKNPLATVVPGAGANQASAIADEIAAIDKTMRDDPKAYYGDEKLQARYRELLSAQEKLGKDA